MSSALPGRGYRKQAHTRARQTVLALRGARETDPGPFRTLTNELAVMLSLEASSFRW